jgi:hypothetical protein
LSGLKSGVFLKKRGSCPLCERFRQEVLENIPTGIFFNTSSLEEGRGLNRGSLMPGFAWQNDGALFISLRFRQFCETKLPGLKSGVFFFEKNAEAVRYASASAR